MHRHRWCGATATEGAGSPLTPSVGQGAHASRSGGQQTSATWSQIAQALQRPTVLAVVSHGSFPCDTGDQEPKAQGCENRVDITHTPTCAHTHTSRLGRGANLRAAAARPVLAVATRSPALGCARQRLRSDRGNGGDQAVHGRATGRSSCGHRRRGRSIRRASTRGTRGKVVLSHQRAPVSYSLAELIDGTSRGVVAAIPAQDDASEGAIRVALHVGRRRPRTMLRLGSQPVSQRETPPFQAARAIILVPGS